MSKTFGRIAAIKASRKPGDFPELSFNRLRRNQDSGIETTLLMDCNVVIHMRNAVQVSDEVERNKSIKALTPLAAFLRECSERQLRYTVSPFFGLNEMRSTEAGAAVSALDEFSRIFGLHWIDADNAVAGDPTTLGLTDRGFLQLPDDVQHFVSAPYAGLLLMLIVARDVQADPVTKFRRYLRLYRRLINVTSIREITIARFLFAPEPVEGTRFHDIWKPIVLNFTGRKKLTTKLHNRSDHLDRAASNGALDLQLLNAANLSDYTGVDGRRQDTWVLTGDLKLAALTAAVHHTDLGTGLVGLAVATEDFGDQGEYWHETNRDMAALNSAFRMNLKVSPRRQRQRAIALLAMAERGLMGQLAYPGAPLRHWGPPHTTPDSPFDLVESVFKA
ncbi:hypothetical protein [Stenotrophomonas sp. S39]|uniref:hypothetical protein n=1 Tax=Stenotrophomonas sp. S39 TaxID=2767451 RepID=UPI00190A11B5|nr:hypothetical protein [Stenotrophomonas sp. S39]MBK0055616.1 hypothetical protein [Stenotrophomonas sp. S39]